MSEDPERKILDWCGHLAVPMWQNSSTNCHSCSCKFSLLKSSHNCRLCGFLFCQQCTGKYHVPLIFRVKHKDGPARVCVACVEGCLAEKRKCMEAQTRAAALSTTQATLSSNIKALVNTVEISPPLTWESMESYDKCPKCSTVKSKGKHHTCRCCGRNYCESCTSKMDIPAYFERKPGKKGPSRVCDNCRFKIVGGAKFVEVDKNAAKNNKNTLLPQIAELIQQKDQKAARPCQYSGCCMEVEDDSTSSFCSVHSRPSACSVTVVLDVLSISLDFPTGDTTSLATVDVAFKKAGAPHIKYEYIFGGEPIPQLFWDVFQLRHFGDTVYARYVEDEVDNGDSLFDVSASGDESLKLFKIDAQRSSIIARSVAPPPPPKPVIPFHTPSFAHINTAQLIKAPSILQSTLHQNNKAQAAPDGAPPPPPDAAMDSETVNDTLQSRAKMLFGAL